MPMSGYTAFRIAEDVPVGNESPGLIGIEVKLKSPTPVLSGISFPPTLARGSTGNVVSALQQALKTFGTTTDPGPIDGDFGAGPNRPCAPVNPSKTLQSMGLLGIRRGGFRQELPVQR